jgi:hypothetical protein
MSPVHIGLMLMGVADDDSVKIDPGRHDARYTMQQSTIQNTFNIALGGLIPAELNEEFRWYVQSSLILSASGQRDQAKHK